MHYSWQGKMGVARGDQTGATFRDSRWVESKQAVNRVKMMVVARKDLIGGWRKAGTS